MVPERADADLTGAERLVPARASCRFTKRERLLTSREFQRVYRHGRQLHSSLFTVFVAPNRLGRTRLGVTTSRKLSKSAVERNRCRRRVREAFRRQRASLPVGWDMVVNVKFQMIAAPHALLEKEFARLMGKLSTLAASPAPPPAD
ncbi:MAG: ribonuclease P protein component [Chloracidobacterium sp. CP2_5A]|nr:MAG: ribonuclease P protein component [Chloracidobacterium sp. CP2_5A]